MTYYELWLDAVKKLDNNEITLGEYDKLIAPLHREVDTLDKIKAEIENETWGVYFEDENNPVKVVDLYDVLHIIDKYRGDIK